jgi:drug/metabolite transporter superfamily protein YnfA
MSQVMALCVLFLAALLEAGGDALVRSGLEAPTLPVRLGFFTVGGLVLFSYGYVVNTPTWDFGRLLGIYVVFFFVVAQFISWLTFNQAPSRGVLIGGAFVVAGGVIMSAWSN